LNWQGVMGVDLRFFLIEDDPATRRMLENILRDGAMGDVVGTAASGSEVSMEHVRDADIVLIDLLMPGRDGIETIRELKAQGYAGRFVMISQVENKEMVGEAYLAGVEYFIHKPVNRVEVLGVLRRVAENLSLQQSIVSIRRSLSALDELSPTRTQHVAAGRTFTQSVHELLARLGIAGEAGASDLAKLLGFLHGQEEQGRMRGELPMLKEMYVAYLEDGSRNLPEEHLSRETKALEQRLRRLTLQALGHLASIGLTDYANPIFEHFAPRLFDFGDVRLRMDELRAGEKSTKCRLNIKKFLSALYAEAKAMHDA
jgi:two-component system, response regulator YcbB